MRGREHCRGDPGGSAPSGGYAPDSAEAEGSSIVDDLFFLRVPRGAADRQDAWGFFKDAQGFKAGFVSSRPPPPWTSVFQFSLFLYDLWT